MAVGVSEVPTPYTVTIGGIPVFVRCGADLLLTGRTLDLAARARCPVCAGETRFEIRGGEVVGLRPEGAVVHVVEVPMGARGIGVLCEESHLFDRRACLEAWRALAPRRDGTDWAPADYLRHLRTLRG